MIAGPSPAAPQVMPEHKTYVYKTADGKPLQLNVFFPGAAEGAKAPVPVIIMFHGGSWTKGDRNALNPESEYFARRGIVAVTADYRYLDKKAPGFRGTPEICLLDAKSAIRWVRSHAAELGVDPKRVILSGGSAGGQLATMAQFETGVNDPQDDTSIPTTGVAMVLFNPAYMPGSQPVMGPTRLDAKLEPYPYVSAQVPPMIMFFGSNDPLEKNAELFVKPCRALGVRAEIWIAPGEKHSFFNKPAWLLATCVQGDIFLTSLGLLPPPTSPRPTPTVTLVAGP
jgi:acetyl esterase/lipase